MSAQKIEVRNHVQPHDSIVDTAEAIGVAIEQHLRAGHTVQVSLIGVHGVSSSFFNVILAHAASGMGGILDERRVDFEFANLVQRLVFDRCVAALKSESSPKSS